MNGKVSGQILVILFFWANGFRFCQCLGIFFIEIYKFQSDYGHRKGICVLCALLLAAAGVERGEHTHRSPSVVPDLNAQPLPSFCGEPNWRQNRRCVEHAW